MKKYSVVVILAILLSSCMVNLEEWFTNDQLKIPIVESFICPDSIFMVNLYFSGNLNDINQKDYIPNAKIALLENGEFVDSIVYLDQGQYLSSKGLKPAANKWYSVEITIPEFGILSATDSVPSIPNVESVSIIPEFYYNDVFPLSKNSIVLTGCGTNTGFYEIQLKFKENNDSIYRLASLTSNSRVIQEEEYYPIQEMMKNTSFHYLPFSSVTFSSDTMEIEVLYQTTISQSGGDTYYYQRPHNLITCTKRVSKTYYQFKSSLLQQEESREGNPLYGLSEPINVFSNITGNGAGVFAAYNQILDTTKVETNH